MSKRTNYLTLVALAWFTIIQGGHAAVRLALMDFSTEANSCRHMQAAADLTSLVQSRLGSTPDIEWVERSQIQLPQAELALAEALSNGGASALRRGRMLGADWLVQGQLSTDDDDRPAVRLEVVDLAHADGPAASTTPLPITAGTGKPLGEVAAEAVTAALRPLLASAWRSSAEAAQAARVAMLFLVDKTPFPLDGRAAGVADAFRERLEQRAATNGRHG
jgi:hypothetical protein